MRAFFAILATLLVACTSAAKISNRSFGNDKAVEKFSWTKFDYVFPSEKVKQEYIESGGFIPENSLPVGIELWQNKLFVTVPRWKKGMKQIFTKY